MRKRAMEFEQALKQEGGLANLAALNRASEFDLTNTSDVFKFLYSEMADMAMFDADKRQEAGMYIADVANKFTLAELEQTLKQGLLLPML